MNTTAIECMRDLVYTFTYVVVVLSSDTHVLDTTMRALDMSGCVLSTLERTYVDDARNYVVHVHMIPHTSPPHAKVFHEKRDVLVVADHDPSTTVVVHGMLDHGLTFVGVRDSIPFSGPYPFMNTVCAQLTHNPLFCARFDAFVLCDPSSGVLTWVPTWHEFLRCAEAGA